MRTLGEANTKANARQALVEFEVCNICLAALEDARACAHGQGLANYWSIFKAYGFLALNDSLRNRADSAS